MNRNSTPVLRSRSRTNETLLGASCNEQRNLERIRPRSRIMGGRNNKRNNEEDPLADKPEDEIVEDPPPAKRPLFQLLTDEDSLLPMQSRDTGTTEKIYVEHTDAPKDACIRQINGIKSNLTRKTDNPYRPSDANPWSSQRFIWSFKATLRLLKLWEQHLHEFRGKKKNTEIYKEMERQMRSFGEPNHTEIKGKMDNLSRKYRQEAEKLRQTGVRSQWVFFHTIQKFLIGTKSVNVFEDIMFEKNESSTNLSIDLSSDDNEMHSRMDSPASSPKHEEDESDDHAHEDTFAKHDLKEYPEDFKEDQHERTNSSTEFQSELNMKESTSERLLEIEEEKLSIEREKLKVMKAAVRELSAFHRDILQFFKEKNK